PQVKVWERGQPPDVLGIMCEIAEQSSDDADGSEYRQRQIFTRHHARHRDDRAGDESWRVPAKKPGKEAALHAEVERVVSVPADYANGSQHAEHSGEPQREVKLLAKRAVIAQQSAAERPIADHDAGHARDHA